MKYRELTPNEIEAYNIGYKNGSRQAVIKILEFETPEEKIFYRQGYNAGCQDRKRHNVSTNEIGSNVSNVSNVDSYDSTITNTIVNNVDNNNTRNSNKGGMGGKEKGGFVPPTPEEVLKYAKEMNEYAGLGGFVCSQEEAQLFYDYYSGIGWCLPNEHSTPIREWKPFLRKWVKNPRRYATKVASQMSVKEMKAAENHVKLQKMLNGEL